MTQFGTVKDHLKDLKKALLGSIALILTSLVCVFFFYEQLTALLLLPLPEGAALIFLSPEGGLLTILNLSLWVSVLGSAPVWGVFLIQFVFPALLPGEKKLIFPILYGTVLFAILGVFFAYFATIPTVIAYLWSFNETFGENLWSFPNYLSFVTTLILCTTLLFECAFLLLLLTHFEVVSTEQLKKGRKGFILASLTIAALLTPPDVISQLISAGILILCYELSICYAKIKVKKRTKKVPL